VTGAVREAAVVLSQGYSASAGRPVCGGSASGESADCGPVSSDPVRAEEVGCVSASTDRAMGEPASCLPATGVPASGVPATDDLLVSSEPGPGQPVSGERGAEPGPADSVEAWTARGTPAGGSPGGAGACFRVGSIGGRPARINVTVPLSVLLGADRDVEEAARRRWDPATTDPVPPVQVGEVALLEGYGPVTPDVARALAMGGVWRRLVTDPTSGTVLDVGRTRYTPPPEMADLVRARDRYCVRPGCGARAQGCDLDHTTPFHLGGRTAVDNLGALCASDHALKTDGVYRVEQPEEGVFVFHLPSGHSYRRERDGSTTMLGRRDPDGDPGDGSGDGPARVPGSAVRREPDDPPGGTSGDAGPPPF